MAKDDLEEALGAEKQAAKELARATARLTKRVLSKAEVALKDPSGSAKKAAKRAAQELDAASKEIDRILKEL